MSVLGAHAVVAIDSARDKNVEETLQRGASPRSIRNGRNLERTAEENMPAGYWISEYRPMQVDSSVDAACLERHP